MPKDYTKGPWNIISSSGTDVLTQGERKTNLFYISEAPGLGHQGKAIKAMIEATPEVLSCLKDVLNGNVYGDAAKWNETIDKARAVLEKLEGSRWSPTNAK